MKQLLNLFKRYITKPGGVYLVALQGKVVITSGTSIKDRVVMSPEIARKLASELQAFATIAERFNTEGVQATVQP